MLPTKEISRAALERFQAYETGDPVKIMGTYTDDVQYWDTKGAVKGKAALHKHLGEFIKRFDVRYAILEEHRLEGQDSAIVLWECAVRRRLEGGSLSNELVMQRGMNLLQVKDGQICREESYADIASLDQLFTPQHA